MRGQWICIAIFIFCFENSLGASFSKAYNDSTDKPHDLRLQHLTPSSILKRNQFEIKLFNNLYTQTANFDGQGNTVEHDQKSTYNTLFIQTLYGLSSTFNIGLDVYIKSVKIDRTSTSPFNVFNFENNTDARTAVSQVGPRIKFNPIKSISRLSLQSVFLFPFEKNMEGNIVNRPFLEFDRYLWWTQLFYDKSLHSNFHLFSELDFFARLKKGDGGENSLATPVKLISSYFPTKRATVYGMAGFWPDWEDFTIGSYFGELGIGGKYQIMPNMEVEIVYTNFIIGKNTGAGQTFNLGIRMIK